MQTVKLTLIILLLVITMLTACSSSPPSTSARTHADYLRDYLLDESNPYVMVVAHRGCWHEAPENSIESIEVCIDSGVDMVELDVRATADGVLVLMHDSTVDRTTTGSGKISGISFAELRTFLLRETAGGDAIPVDHREIRVPTLEEALLASRGRILINIDAKEALYEPIFNLVEKTGTQDQVLIKKRTAPDDPELRQSAYIKKALFMPVIVQCDADEDDQAFCTKSLVPVVEAFSELQPVAYEIVYQENTFLTEAIPTMRQSGRVWVNTLQYGLSGTIGDEAAAQDPANTWGKLVADGVSMIQTDYPIELITYLKTTGLRD